MARQDIDNREDVLDSRDVIKRIEELEEEREGYEIACPAFDAPAEAHDAANCAACGGSGMVSETEASRAEWATVNEDDAEELRVLKALAEEGENSADWPHGETLIRDSYFEDYARQLAEDVGLIKGDESWPLNCIDWEKAARELKYDYSAIDFDGVTYWIRS